MSEHEGETLFSRGDLVWVKTDDGFWKRGIITDVFLSPLTGVEVVVVGGDGYYTESVVPDPEWKAKWRVGVPVEPESIRA